VAQPRGKGQADMIQQTPLFAEKVMLALR